MKLSGQFPFTITPVWISTITAFAMIVFLPGCDSRRKEVGSTATIDVTVSISADQIEGLESIYDGSQVLEYRLNGINLGENDAGANALLTSLRSIKETHGIQIAASPRLVAGTGPAVVRGTVDLVPYIKDTGTAGLIRRELDRIRGHN